jgi:pantoate kinase
MAATPESKVKAHIKAVLKKHNVYFIMPIGTGYGNSGVPDFLCCIDGKFLAIEAKAGSNKPTALQNKHLNDIKDTGGIAMVINDANIDSFEGFILLIKDQK